ncbi:lectin-like domain-containing protein [Algibacter sp. Ld11]|uniref:lectin-like domain-containing protein n=1 Tax=Algibacter sp. Ld11 TaxID=649150 RepID=UPI003866CA2A
MAFLNSSIKKVFFITLLVFCCQLAKAQLKATTVGSASDLGDNCFEITPDLRGQAGGVWFDHPIDFSSDFIISYQNYFGKNNGGADGMALVFKTTTDFEIRPNGGDLGYEGIPNSLIVEFDTYQNINKGDPGSDHIALVTNGVSDHSLVSNLVGPISTDNIEDDTWHNVKIEWVASSQIFYVYFDCELILSKTQDFKTTIFNNENAVYFGFVGATGGASNLHEVCLNRVSFIDNLIASNEVICSGETIEKDVSISSGVTYSWSPNQGVSDPASAKPILSPKITTEYSVTITDECGDVFVEFLTVTVLPIVTPTFDDIENVCLGNPFYNLPTKSNEGIIGFWSPEINLSKTTTYTFIPNSEECAESISLTVTIPTFDIVNNLCEGDAITPLPSISNEGIEGVWSPKLNNRLSTTYTFTPNSDECAQSITKYIEVFSITPLALLTVLEPDSFSENQRIEIGVTGGSGFYEYQLDDGDWQNDAVFESVSRCIQHEVGVRDVYGCAAEIRESVDLIFHPKFFTPNGDGYHELWNIKCLEAHPEAVIFIYNRHGGLLQQIKPNQSGWDGTYKGSKLPAGGYWFVAYYLDENNVNKQKRGYFTLKR